ncbi:MAG: hypothetical protein ACYC3L_11025 [Gemmatimonadaceae bacterium]
MRRKIPALLVALSIGWSASARAQQSDWVNQILSAALLPVVTTQARLAGLSDADIRAALDAMSSAGLSAQEATVVFENERTFRKEHGPVNNFGSYVQDQLKAGKRGPELAAAIRAEHVRQGKGNAMRGKDKDRDNDELEKKGKKDKDDGNRGKGRGPGNSTNN